MSGAPLEADVFRAVADPTRRAMLDRLRDGDLTVGDLAVPLKMTRAAVSQHVRVLRLASLVRTRRDGRHVVCSLHREPMRRVSGWASRFAGPDV